LPRLPLATANVRGAPREPPEGVTDEVARLNAELDGSGRVLVRPSGTEPVVRILVEAENRVNAEAACATICALVTRELG